MDIGWPTEKLTIVGRRSLASQLRPEVRRYRPDSEIWQRVIKERENFIHSLLWKYYASGLDVSECCCGVQR
jgi:hypothetical protein